jgi:hypothetical protein
MVYTVMKSIKQTAVLIGCALFAAIGLLAIQPAPAYAAECGGVKTSIISCDQTGGNANVRDSGVWGVLLLAINIMIAVVGVAALAGIIYGAILYTSAGGNSEQTKKGMQIIGNVVIGLIAFSLMYVGLNFLIPGGVFTA